MTRVRTTVDLLRRLVNKMHSSHTSVLLESLEGPLFEELYLRNLVHRATGNIVKQTSVMLQWEMRDE